MPTDEMQNTYEVFHGLVGVLERSRDEYSLSSVFSGLINAVNVFIKAEFPDDRREKIKFFTDALVDLADATDGKKVVTDEMITDERGRETNLRSVN
jgi:hypothetical protein